MKKIIYFLIILLVIVISYSVVIDTNNFFLNIINTLNLFIRKVYPSIFTFYIIASLLINTNILNKFIYLFRVFFKRLKFTNQLSLNIFLTSIFTGNPGSSSLIIENISKKNLSVSDANYLLKVAAFFNPLFIFAFLNTFNIKYALVIIFVHIASNCLIALYLNRNNTDTIITDTSLKFSFKELITSINYVVQVLLIVSAMMVFANIIIFSINTVLNAFNISSFYINIILTQFEISTGLNSIIGYNLHPIIKLFLICFTISFNGLCIHLQVANIISMHNLKFKYFFIYRIVQSIISCIILLFFILI